MIPDPSTNSGHLICLYRRRGSLLGTLFSFVPVRCEAVVERHALLFAHDEWKTASCRGEGYPGLGVLYTAFIKCSSPFPSMPWSTDRRTAVAYVAGLGLACPVFCLAADCLILRILSVLFFFTHDAMSMSRWSFAENIWLLILDSLIVNCIKTPPLIDRSSHINHIQLHESGDKVI